MKKVLLIVFLGYGFSTAFSQSASYWQQKADYKIVYEQVALLSDKEANLIKEVLEFSMKQNQPQHLIKLAEKIKIKLGIETVKEKNKACLLAPYIF